MTNIENKMYQVKVVKISGLNRSTKAIRMVLADKKQVKDFTFVPGQFIMLGVLGYGEAALTITTAPSELPEFEVAARSVGVATQSLHRLKVGDTAYFRGPLGNTIIGDDIYGKELILIGGGIGLAPLRSIIQMVRDDKTIVGKLIIIYGAKTPEDLVFKGELTAWKKFADMHVTVDKADRDWNGETGRVADALVKVQMSKDAIAVVCGPEVMYDSVAKILLGKGLSENNIQFMLERRVKCGIGKCQHCTCGEKYVCLDGPTFTWKEIKDNWEALR